MSDMPIRSSGGSFEELLQRQLSIDGGLAPSQPSQPHPHSAKSFAQQFEEINQQFEPSPQTSPRQQGGYDKNGYDEHDDDRYQPNLRLDGSSDFRLGYEEEEGEFEDAHPDEHELNEYNDYDDDEHDAYSSHSNRFPSSFETSFPLPSLARAQPLSPLRESSQEIDTERLRHIRANLDEEEEEEDENRNSAGDGDSSYRSNGIDVNDSGDHLGGDSLYATAVFQPSPELPHGRTRSVNQPGHQPLRRSQEEIDEFEQLEAQAKREAEAEEEMKRFQQQHQQQQQQQPKRLRPSNTQLNNSLTRQQMLQIDQEQQQRSQFGVPDTNDDEPPYQPPPHLASSPLFDDDEEWTDPAPKQRSTGASQSRIPVRSPPRHSRGVHDDDDAHDDSVDSSDDYQRDPLAMAQIIPPAYGHNRHADPSPQQHQQAAAPPTSTLVKKYFDPVRKPAGSARPSSAPGARKTTTSTTAGTKSGSNKKKPAASSTSSSSSDKSGSSTSDKSLAGEIEKYSRETIRLQRLSKEQEQELTFLRREKSVALEKLQVERDEFERFKEEETKKLRAGRVALEKERRLLTGQPDRRDRDVIEELKKQVAQLQEELQSSHEKHRSNESRLKKERDSLANELKQLKHDLASQEARRIDEWEAREKEFHQQLAQQEKEKERKRQAALAAEAKEKEDRDRRDRDRMRASTASAAAAYQADPIAAVAPAAPHSQWAQPRQTTNTAVANSYTHAPTHAQQPTTNNGYSNPLAASQQRPQPPADMQQVQQHQQYVPSSAYTTSSASGAPHASGYAASSSSISRSAVPVAPSPSVSGSTSGYGLIDRGPSAHTLSVLRELVHDRGQVERHLSDQSKLILFKNGTTRRTFADGFVEVTFPNGDKKQTDIDQRVIYYYHAANTTHITYPSGLQVYQFANGQTEHHYPSGEKQINFEDGTVKHIQANGIERVLPPNNGIGGLR